MASTATQFDTDCKLMLHMDGADASTTFTDSSTTGNTMTASGSAQIDTAQSVFGGASGLFDGSGDYLSTTDKDGFNIAANNFTIDLRVRFSSVVNSTFMGQGLAGSSNLAFEFYFLDAATAGTNQMRWAWSTDGTSGTRTILNNVWNPSVDTWYHIAVIRNGSNLMMFVNGTQIGITQTMNQTAFNSSADIRVGELTVSHTGWMDELRFVNGTAVWTGNFTPPSAAYTQAAGTAKPSRMMLMGIS